MVSIIEVFLFHTIENQLYALAAFDLSFTTNVNHKGSCQRDVHYRLKL